MEDGKRRRLLLKEIDLTQEGLDIAQIINDEGLDGDFPIGSRIVLVRQAYNGTGAYAITEEEKRLAEKLGLVQQEKKSVVAKILEIAKILKDRGVDLSKIRTTKKVNGKTRKLLLKEIDLDQEGLDIAQIIKDNNLDGNYKFGEGVTAVRQAYNGTGTYAITEEEKRLAEELGLVQKEKKNAVAETLEIAKKLRNYGVDLSKIRLSKTVNGKTRKLLLKEITQEGLDIAQIIKDNDLDGDFPLGCRITWVRLAYNGKGTCAITEAEKRLAEELGLVRIRDAREIADATGGDVLNNVEQADTITEEFNNLINQNRNEATIGEFSSAEGTPGDGEAPGQE